MTEFPSADIALAALGAEPVAVDAPEVWRAPLDPPPAIFDGLAALLSRGERAEAARQRDPIDVRRRMTARALVRLLLGRRLKVPPEAVALRRGPQGKPLLFEPPFPLHFNLSHCGDWAVVALGSRPVGIDLERPRPVDMLALAERFCSPGERDRLARLPEAARQNAFFAAWVAKEAVAKARGDGLRLPFRSIELDLADPAAPRLVALAGDSGAARSWSLRSIPAVPGHCCAVAVAPVAELRTGAFPSSPAPRKI